MKQQSEQRPTATLAPLYGEWLDALLEGPISAEDAATCQNCAMCDMSKDDDTDAIYFDQTVKCCSYVPELPNFLVGYALATEDPAESEGPDSLRARITAREAVTPLGLRRSAEDRALYEHANRTVGFGRSSLVRCPHYDGSDGGRCTIWPHRNAVCSSWHCKYSRGAAGSSFWSAVERLLSQIEDQLALWCLTELDFDPETIAEMSSDSKASDRRGADAENRYRKIWNRWDGSEEEVYRACAGLVASLSWDEVLEICGPEVRLAARVLQARHRAMRDPSLPSRLRPGKMELIRLGDESCRAVTYSPTDPVELPRAVLDLLAMFDGRSTKEVIRAVREELGVETSPGLLRKLVDFRFLVPDDADLA